MHRLPIRSIPILLLAACASVEPPKAQTLEREPDAAPALAAVEFAIDERPERQHYVALRAPETLAIDGSLDEAAWTAAPSTATFVDIQGDPLPEPRLATSAKMLWDAEYLYIGVVMVEPHLWATLTERDSVIFYDNDFEVFLDPDDDTHNYYELEINALGTEWDLLLQKPYRDGGPALNEFDTPGLLSAVRLVGTLNDPSDLDEGWSMEIAIPWNALRAIAGRTVPPVDGDVWWANFSRVEWKLDVAPTDAGDTYVKRTNEAGASLPEDNWVWSPQGVIAMHEPESWGLVMFADQLATEFDPSSPRAFVAPADFEQRGFLRAVYESQAAFRAQHGLFSEASAELGINPKDLGDWALALHTTPSGYEARLTWSAISADGTRVSHTLRIDEQGHIW